MKLNWLKMYKAGCIRRVEAVINDPEEFRVRRRVTPAPSFFRPVDISGAPNEGRPYFAIEMICRPSFRGSLAARAATVGEH
jgi:hypothetical protein